ncbi:hypothetical protein HXX76_004269 [Chlamydomonas incerta]|uniref:Integrase catalytic domain-containing protein n=1 Tax=Chlamydomonas incerta TaxID=51695 RepID=A0A835W8R2_CHLIN|nr:hypothetical protein HXX76_004269 [Chlamydomonas incerta]|eukprot:KAG2440156.1 hypothetical protein HXX76_004269 [Chlamydomonas incerta]
MVHLAPCTSSDGVSAESAARMFVDNVVRLHGVPKDIISDRGAAFTSKFWTAVCELLGIKRKLSTAYHPQTDGQTERMNRTLGDLLRNFAGRDPESWDRYLSAAEFAMNNAIGFLGKSPNVRIYPNYSDPSVYLQLRFGRVAELDAAGRPVPGHFIPSMAQVGAVNFTSGNMTVVDVAGRTVNLSYVNVTLTPFDRPGFFPGCMPPPNDTLMGAPPNDTLQQPNDRPTLPPGASAPPVQPLPFARGDGSRPSDGSLPPNGSLPFNGSRPLDGFLPPNGSFPLDGSAGLAPARVDISILFGLDDELTVMYGAEAVTVPKNGLKWSVSVRDWPWCNLTNTLAVSLDILLANNATAAVTDGTGGNGESMLTVALGDAYNASLAFLPYALEAQDGTIKMPISLSVDEANATDSDPARTTLVMKMPNPQNYNQTSVFYDPTSTTTSAYLATTDTSNVDVSTLVATTQSASDTSTTSSSSSLSDGAKIGIIAGCAVGGALLTAGAVVGAVVAKRRREGFNKVAAVGAESA